MNGSVSHVLKTSEALLRLPMLMARDKGVILSTAYAYFDGTFKRCPGYVTLACHVYS